MSNKIKRISSFLSLEASYGFYEECIEKYGDERVWSYFSDLFCYLPIGSIINDRYLAVHGGLSPSLCSIDQIQELNRVKQVPTISF